MTTATLITGANRGIGQALLSRMAARGPAIGTHRSAPPEPPSGADWMPLDVANPASHTALAERLDGRPLGLVVCNAGVYLDKGQPLADGFPADQWAATFAANVTGVFLTVQTLLPNLQAAPAGKVAIISSAMASSERAPGGSYIYRSSKAAALNLGRNLAVDLAGLGIAVGIYHPGWVRTDMGGTTADLDVDTAADGLMARFDALTLEHTGRFETWDGVAIPY